MAEVVASNLYGRKNIRLFEEVFGKTFVSPGGKSSAVRFARDLPLFPGCRVLDVGCGAGGSALHLAEAHGAHVDGIDLSEDMIDMANEYKESAPASVGALLNFIRGDAVTADYRADFYDIVYSRDVILHIADKEKLFRRLFVALKPGGTLLVTDYCKGKTNDLSEGFKEYLCRNGYSMLTVDNYAAVIESAGFVEVEKRDLTRDFVAVSLREVEEFEAKREEIIRDYSQEGYDMISRGWRTRNARCEEREQLWGYFRARKPTSMTS